MTALDGLAGGAPVPPAPAVLERDFAAVAHEAVAPSTDAAGGVLLRLGTTRYAVPMADVAEVTGMPRTTRLPGSPPWLTGVANWRGRVLPVLDIRSLVGAAVTPLASSARLVVVAAAHGDLTAGVVAEAVPGVYDNALDTCAAPPATLPAEAAGLVVGHVADTLGPIAVLDVVAILGLRERVDRRRRVTA